MGHRRGELAAIGVAAEDVAQGHTTDLGIGHPRLGHLANVERRAVQLLEGASPGDRAGASGGDQGAVDVEEDRLDHLSSDLTRTAQGYPVAMAPASACRAGAAGVARACLGL